MFKKILIANRGEIACRVAATARRLGLRSVAVYSDADSRAAHVQACDEALRIGGAAPADSYLCGERIIAAALATGAEAIHPGYGFLSENAGFAQACAEAGLVFIGPPPSAIAAMGLKSEAKRLMGQAGVPLVPGYHGAAQDEALLQREADAIGYPVLIKASAGGGGKGMRRVDSADAFAAALASCRREAMGSFGNDAVLIERYVNRPRHIEIQVFADTQGHCVYLFERDCSVQRRHQKVLEEAPAPGMPPARRREMGEAAVAAARAVGYVGAGTVEFIAEPLDGGDLRFYFMEMNTRLQVEHPVTEAITGLDLVEWQLRVAAGEALPLAQDQLQIHGHAIEARLCAENTAQDFLPSTGRLQVMRLPAASAFERGTVRLDAGVREGDSITPFYDPMIAKLIVWGADRAQALARLDQALAQVHIVGPHTNAAFLRRVVGSASFVSADLDTALIEREREALFHAPALPAELAAAGVWAHLLAQERAGETPDPWSRRDGWRLHGPARRRCRLLIDGRAGEWGLEQGRDGSFVLLQDGQRWPLAVSAGQGGWHAVQLGPQRLGLAVYASGRGFSVHGPDAAATVEWLEPGAAPAEARAGQLSAPMPGRLSVFLVAPGEAVVPGQPLAVIEAMKMEHTIVSPCRGTVAALLYAAGDPVEEGAELLQVTAAQD